MSDVLQIANIRVERTRRGLINEHHYRFLLETDTGTYIAASESFRSANVDRQGIPETHALETFVDRLMDAGWMVVRRRSEAWYDIVLAKGSDADVNALKRDSFLGAGSAQPRPSGLSIQAMWAITLGIVILLFACCVVLALTVEIRLTPVIQ